MDVNIIGWVLSGLGAIIMWLAKIKSDSLDSELKSLHADLNYVKEVYFKKEDFREFKAELWSRLDKMENSVETRLDSVVRAYSVRDFPDLR